MKAKRRTLILLLALAALAAAALLWLRRANERAEQEADGAEEGTISLSSFAVDDLTCIEYSYQGQTLTLDYADGVWTLADDPAYHLDQSKCNTMATALSDLRAKRSLPADSGEDYGLAAPGLAVSVTAAGRTDSFAFGSTNSVTGDIYLQKAGDDAVYTASASAASCFAYDKAGLFGAFNPAGITAGKLTSIAYTNAAGTSVSLQSVSVAAESGDASSDSAARYTTVWRLSDEPDAALDEESVNGILSALGGYVSGQITGADPALYGFDAPDVTVTASDDERSYTLYYTAGADGWYMMAAGDDSVYLVDSASLAAFALTAEELKAG